MKRETGIGPRALMMARNSLVRALILVIVDQVSAPIPNLRTTKPTKPSHAIARSSTFPIPMAAFDSSSVTILGVGNPLLDISTVVPESVLDKYGVKVRGEKKRAASRALAPS